MKIHATRQITWLGIVALMFAGSAAAQQHDQLPSIQLPAELDRVLRDYEAAWGNRDAAALAALFVEDGFVLSPGRPPVRGRAAIEKRYQGSGGPLSLRALDYATDGALGYIIGGYAGSGGETDDGKFTLVLRRTDEGRWLIVSDMDNGNSRPPGD
jgi:ketosteroid isomerase-like protein